MDTILFRKDTQGGYSKPSKWIYTDLLGRVQYKDIQNLTLEQVIKAFLTNLKQSNTGEGNDIVEDNVAKKLAAS